jgi:hypothetical protein
VPDRTIFRQSAMDAYRRRAEEDVVPHLIYWPIVVCLWLLVGVLLAAGLLAWYVQVPAYVDGSGIILADGGMRQRADGETVAVVFLPPDRAAHVRIGLPVHVQIGSAGVYVRGRIAKVEPGITSPDAVRKRYRLDNVGSVAMTQPSIVAIVRLGTTLRPTAYAGSRLRAQVQIGSQRPLALFPGVGRLLGGNS